MNCLSTINEILRIGKWKLDDILYQMTGKERFYRVAETPFYNFSSVVATPFIEELPFFLYVPWEQEKGNEYFVVCNHFAQNLCTKTAKISFYRPEYYDGGILTGHRKWILTKEEKGGLVSFLNDNSHWFTVGLSWYRNMIAGYNSDISEEGHNELIISEDNSMPDYNMLPEA